MPHNPLPAGPGATPATPATMPASARVPTLPPPASAALPPLFLSHGSPMTALQPRAAGRFWQDLARAIEGTQGRPRAVLVVSAHSLRG